jgi:ATP/maltotriose-dependent transcriptional regulator MalT/two-component SAPR family response regulator
VVLRAPAGYGKSVLASQLTRAWNVPSAWYQLDREDDDASVFTAHLIESARHSLSLPMADFEGQLDVCDPSQIVPALVNAFDRSSDRGVAIVLENCQHITNLNARLLIGELIEHAPPNLSLVLTSRGHLPVNITRYLASLEAIHLGVDELKMSDSEVDAVVATEIGTAIPDLSRAISEESEGWPALVRLMACEQDSQHTMGPSGLPRSVDEYLASEVVSDNPDDVQQFLRATSILDFLTPELCDSYLEIRDSAAILEYLEESQLVVPADQEYGPALRYLRPLRRFLQGTLGADRQQLLARAASCELQMGRVCSAIEHFLLAGAVEDAAQAIRAVGEELIQYERYELLERWIGALPPALVRSDPWLSLWWGLVKKPVGRLDTAQVYLEHALKGFRRNRDRYGVAEAQLGLAAVLTSRGEHAAALESIELAVPRVIERKNDLVPELLSEQAFLLALCGRMNEATAIAADAQRMAQLSRDRNVLARVGADVSFVYYLSGDHAAALHMRNLVYTGPDGSERVSHPHDSALARKDAFALALRDRGELDAAFDHASSSLNYKIEHGLIERLPSAYYQMGVVCTDLGEFLRAEEAFAKIQEITSATGGERLFTALSLGALSRLRCLQGRLIEAQTLADQGLEAARSLNKSPYLEAVCAIPVLIPRILAGDMGAALSMASGLQRSLWDLGARYAAALNLGIMCFISDSVGDRSAALDYARRCLAESARARYVQEYVILYSVYMPVLRAGLELGVEVGFVHEILERVGPPAFDLVMELAGGPESEVRRRAAVLLAHYPSIAPTTVDESETRWLEQAPEAAEEAAAASSSVSPSASSSVLSSSPSSVLSQASSSVSPSTESTASSPTGPAIARVRECGARLYIECFGSFRVSAAGKEIQAQDWRTTKSRDLLAYLVHRREPVSGDAILADLWPAGGSEQSRATLHTNVYYLRRTLQTVAGRQEMIIFAGGLYQLAGGFYTTDVDRFETLLASGLSEDRRTVFSPALLEKAIALYRGDYLESLDYSWVSVEQTRLRRAFLDASERLAQYYLKIHDYSKALPHALALANALPLSEDAHVLVMKSYAGLGDFASVKEQFRRMAVLFDEELGASPSSETRRLYYSLFLPKHRS